MKKFLVLSLLMILIFPGCSRKNNDTNIKSVQIFDEKSSEIYSDTGIEGKEENAVIDENIISEAKTTVEKFSLVFEENGYTVACENVEQEILSGKRYVLTLSGVSEGRITLYEYVDFEHAQEDSQHIDESGNEVSFDSEKTYITWKSTPHFYQFNNLIVQYVGTDKIILDLLLSLCGEQFAGGNLY